jgi:hypothetical protein
MNARHNRPDTYTMTDWDTTPAPTGTFTFPAVTPTFIFPTVTSRYTTPTTTSALKSASTTAANAVSTGTYNKASTLLIQRSRPRYIKQSGGSEPQSRRCIDRRCNSSLLRTFGLGDYLLEEATCGENDCYCSKPT